MIKIRPAELRDAAAHAEIRNAIEPEPVTAEMVTEWFNVDRTNPHQICIRLSAEDETGRVVATGYAKHSNDMNPGQFWGNVRVAPDAKGKGVGTAVAQYMEDWARANGGTEFESGCHGDDDEAYTWAQRRGYVSDRLRTESVRDMSDWDGNRFADAVARVQQAGFRLMTTFRQADDEHLMRGAYDVFAATWRDVPSANTAPPTYAQWEHEVKAETEEFVSGMAFAGDRMVGLTTMIFPKAPGSAAWTGYTGVHPDFRGHGIALAIKVLVINIAAERGVPRLRTNNDPDNPAMLRVNEKLGYKLVPGPRRLVKKLV